MALISICTPATTANLGPGFDCLGIALELYNKLEASWEGTTDFNDVPGFEAATWLQIHTKVAITGEGGDKLTKGGMNLFFEALSDVLALPCGGYLFPVNLSLQFTNNIPLARGLGSSAACILSALCLGKAILADMGHEIDEESLLSKAIKFDYYPDNVIPAFFGGACLSIVQNDALPLVFPLEIPEELNFVLAIPELIIRSAEAREVLPKTVIFKEAVENSALLGALILSLEKGDFTHLAGLVKSPLHVSYRSQLIPGYRRVEKAAYNHGALAFTISGAGPSVLALAIDNCQEIGSAMVEAFGQVGITARYFISKMDSGGIRVKNK
ncbi:MAG: homoserine kinase [Firmicutes bacterium]|jgi:homoserine kinase|nr:homoserine kinase [Bacillota bacterium]